MSTQHNDIATQICRAVAELPDRNSPEDWPKAMLVTHAELRTIVLEALEAAGSKQGEPVDMLLFCPNCGKQHIDMTEHTLIDRGPSSPPGNQKTWDNPPHRSHLCHSCGCIWRPADVPTNGVAAVQTRGKADNWIGKAPFAAPALAHRPKKAEEMRPDFEWWWITRSTFPALGTSEAGAAWAAWVASGGYTAPSDWQLSDAPWGWAEIKAAPTPQQAAPSLEAKREAFDAWVSQVKPRYWQADAWQKEAWAMWQSISAAIGEQPA